MARWGRLLPLAALLAAGCASPASGHGNDLGAGVHDLRTVDLAQGGGGDSATVQDAAAPHDAAAPLDFAKLADQSVPFDLATVDLTLPTDAAAPPDMAGAACDDNTCAAYCVAVCFVQMKLGIGQCMAGTCNCVCI